MSSDDRLNKDLQATLPFEQEPVVQSDLPFDRALLSLAAVEGLGHKGLRALAAYLGDQLGAVWAMSPSQIRSVLSAGRVPAAERIAHEIHGLRAALLSKGRDALDALTHDGTHVISPSRIPDSLSTLSDRPWWLFVQGDSATLYDGPHIAVVGTRNPTPHGIKAAEIVVRTMAAYPVVLVSGLANGIDAAAHKTALRDGIRNIAFLGHGIDLTFPAETAELRSRILEDDGAVVTEYLPAEHYRKHYFVQRNRLQAAISRLVIAVEGTANGGTAHTVKFASAYGRHVLGVRWLGAGDLYQLVSHQPLSTILDVFDARGRQDLDMRIRGLAEAEGKDTFALRLVEHLLLREASVRGLRAEDLQKLRCTIDELAKDVE